MEDNNNNDWNIWARDTINKYIQISIRPKFKKRWGIFLNYHSTYFYVFCIYYLAVCEY